MWSLVTLLPQGLRQVWVPGLSCLGRRARGLNLSLPYPPRAPPLQSVLLPESLPRAQEEIK